MTKIEKLVYVGCPWLFGMILVLCGIYLSFATIRKFIAFLAIGFGLICMSLYCVCALLAKMTEKK